MDRQNQYCENDYTTESNLYVQCNPYQNFNDILHQDIKINPKVHMEAQKTLNSHSYSGVTRALLEVPRYLTSNYTTGP
jgi:hypothetical protein